jgi:hydroxymethylpyrimidine pyrophosphatase-like HAD family hydrolase
VTKIKAVLTDLDGTVLFPNDDFTQATKSVILEMIHEGIAVFPVTGRSYRFSIEACKSIGLQSLGVFKGGSVIVDIPTGKILWEMPIDEITAKSVLEGISPLCEYLSFGKGRVRADEITTLLLADLHCLSIWAETKVKNLDTVMHNLNQYDDLAVYISSATDNDIIGIQINHIRANKMYGAKILLELANVEKSKALAIGDDDNDIPFFTAVGTSVAMGNASKGLRRVATHETGTIEEDGFKAAMALYVLSHKGYII